MGWCLRPINQSNQSDLRGGRSGGRPFGADRERFLAGAGGEQERQARQETGGGGPAPETGVPTCVRSTWGVVTVPFVDSPVAEPTCVRSNMGWLRSRLLTVPPPSTRRDTAPHRASCLPPTGLVVCPPQG